MSLSLYKKKRSFEKTPEPAGKKMVSSSAGLRFVVQKHAASRLHYDFRLEMKGVLKSWAVPKGPSLNPENKRLAMMVEDHPFDYRTFEGIIPEGNYGAGTVIVWDEGTYQPMEPEGGTIKQQEKTLLDQLEEGNLKIKLNGKKLKGDFALVRTKGREENAWLLIKKKDEHASSNDITLKTKSVQSGKTLEEVGIKKRNKQLDKNNTAGTKSKKESAIKSSPKKLPVSGKKKIESGQIKDLLKKGKRAAYNMGMKPMLASLTEAPFDSGEWLFEIKWDGYRALAGIRNSKIELQSRNNLSFNKKYYPVTEALSNWKINAIVDGEIIVVNESGITNFQQLQAWQKTRNGQLIYYVFDLLWIEGLSVIHLPLTERKEILKSILPGEDGIIKYSEHIPNDGKDFFALATKEGLEGIMAKKADSLYHPGIRTQQWLKIKTHRRQEVVIAGFTKGRNSRQYFGALILGVYENNDLIYVGHTGSGFNQKNLAEMHNKLQPLVTENCPFKKKPKTNMPAIWVKPKLVAEIKFQEWTNENILRIPIFLALREDKNAIDVKKEEANNMKSSTASKKDSSGTGRSLTPKAAKKFAPQGRKPKEATSRKNKTEILSGELVSNAEKDQNLVIDKQELKFTNLHKYYWKKEKITKRDVLNYYHRIAPFIIPYLKDRAQSLNRHPDGAGGMSFYQKDVAGKVPEWIQTYDYLSESDGELKKFLVCTNEASLLFMANWGCIEMNPWHSRVTSAENPDYCVIDLDPEKISFDKVIETANVVKKVLDELGIDAYCKTSGATGLHIYIPLGAKYSYEQSRQLAELIVQFVHEEIPSFTSLERSPKKRQKKIYLDWLQNRTIQTRPHHTH